MYHFYIQNLQLATKKEESSTTALAQSQRSKVGVGYFVHQFPCPCYQVTSYYKSFHSFNKHRLRAYYLSSALLGTQWRRQSLSLRSLQRVKSAVLKTKKVPVSNHKNRWGWKGTQPTETQKTDSAGADMGRVIKCSSKDNQVWGEGIGRLVFSSLSDFTNQD